MITTDKLIICVAPLGNIIGKDSNPNVPIQPDEIAEDVYRCWNAGAAIVHLHARDKNGVATTDPAIFQEIGTRIREKGCDIIIQHSTAPGRQQPDAPVEEGLRSLDANPEMATADIGALVGRRGGRETVRMWTRSFIENLLKIMLEKNIKPELEIYTPGGLEEVNVMIENGLLTKPYYISFALDMHRRIQNVVRYTPKNMMHYVDLLPPDAMFSAFGVAASELPVAIQSMLLGGHVRVGFEDNIRYDRGVLADSNAQLVERVARIGKELGRTPASPHDARQLLGISPLQASTN